MCTSCINANLEWHMVLPPDLAWCFIRTVTHSLLSFSLLGSHGDLPARTPIWQWWVCFHQDLWTTKAVLLPQVIWKCQDWTNCHSEMIDIWYVQACIWKFALVTVHLLVLRSRWMKGWTWLLIVVFLPSQDRGMNIWSSRTMGKTDALSWKLVRSGLIHDCLLISKIKYFLLKCEHCVIWKVQLGWRSTGNEFVAMNCFCMVTCFPFIKLILPSLKTASSMHFSSECKHQ